MPSILRRLHAWIDEPRSVLRIEIVRIFAPLAILGFMSGRLVHADEWVGDAGFRVPDLGGDWRQPLYIPALPSWAAWAVAAAMVISGLACCLGVKTRASALVFASAIAFAALSDRLASYTVTKLSPAIMLAVAISPAGARFGIDARTKRKRSGKRPKRLRTSGAARFLQILPVVMYSASGIAKARGDWLKEPLVLWTHLHDSYQTPIAFALASVLPAWTWTLSQAMVLAFELLAPLWFALSRTRTGALLFGLTMHAMIGLMFGPVIWFSLLMITLNIGAYAPQAWLERAFAAVARRFAKQPA
ncbi:MAG TPA: HTTM domain-containing protein [Polyangiaceae bacterium]|nr:HTTM domain-containing protein [Polyangiaceae bacterium]